MAIGWATPYLRRKLMDHSNGVATYTPPATLYLILTTIVIPQDASLLPVGTEMTGNGYARGVIANSGTTWNAADASGAATNKILVTCYTASGNTTIPGIGFAWSDAPTGGNLLGAGALDVATPVLPSTGQIVTFPPGSLIRTYSAP